MNKNNNTSKYVNLLNNEMEDLIKANAQHTEQLQQENAQLKKEIETLQKALELICYYMEYKYWKKDDDIWYRKDKELYMYFIDQAKKEIEK